MKSFEFVLEPTFVLLNREIYIPVVLSAIFVYCLVSWKWKGKNQSLEAALSFLPGPKKLPFVGNIFDVSDLNEYANTLLKFAKKYGDCYYLKLFNQHYVFITSGTLAQDLLKSAKFGHTYKHPWTSSQTSPYITYGVGLANGVVHWKNERKLLVPNMSLRHIRDYLKPVNVTSKMLVTELSKLFQDNQEHTVFALVNACIVMHTTVMVTGTHVYDLSECLEHHHGFKRWVLASIEITSKPWLWNKFIYWLHPISRERAAIENKLNSFINKRLEETKDRRKLLKSSTQMEECLIDALLDADIPEYLVLDEIKMLMAAGYEAVGTSMQFTLWMLGLHQEHQNLCREEVDGHFAKMSDENEELVLEDVNSFQYLDMCVSESLRLFPPANSLGRHLQEPLTIEYNGQRKVIPVGVTVTIDLISVLRNPKHYPNPHIFNPSRFTPEEIAKRPPHTFIPFSSGIRGCIGPVYSMASMKLMLAKLLRHFTWSSPDEMDSVRILPGVTIRPDRDIKFKFCQRVQLP